jgi:hypothetical protein
MWTGVGATLAVAKKTGRLPKMEHSPKRNGHPKEGARKGRPYVDNK